MLMTREVWLYRSKSEICETTEEEQHRSTRAPVAAARIRYSHYRPDVWTLSSRARVEAFGTQKRVIRSMPSDTNNGTLIYVGISLCLFKPSTRHSGSALLKHRCRAAAPRGCLLLPMARAWPWGNRDSFTGCSLPVSCRPDLVDP